MGSSERPSDGGGSVGGLLNGEGQGDHADHAMMLD